MTDLWPQSAPSRIDLGDEQEFVLGGMQVRPAELAAEFDGERHELQPRVMQVLVALAKARPSVVSRDKLVSLCWEGRVVGDDALNRCILALRHLSQQFSPQPFAIETVPRVGHRLIENGVEVADAKKPASKAPRMAKSWRWMGAIVVIVLVAVAALLWQQRSAEPEPASIAVLPFRNLSSGDPYFAEGVGEEIMGQLAREPAFQVAGRASAAQFSGPSDPRKVGQALGVDYILEGSVRSEAQRVRVNAALIRTKDGMRLWSDTYDRNLEDILAIQSAIGQAVANGLKRRLVHSRAGARQSVNGEAYALYLNARGLLRSQNPQVGSDAVAYLKQAVRLDPDFAPAWASLAEALQQEAKTKGADGLIAALPRAQAAAERALRIDPNLAQAHGVLGFMLPLSDGREHLLKAAELDPRSGEGLTWKAEAAYASGDYQGWFAAIRRAHEVDPLWPYPLRALVDVSSILDSRKATEAIVRKGFPDDPVVQEFALGRVAWTYGDYSDAARLWSGVTKNSESRWAPPARLSLDDLSYMLNLSDKPPTRPAVPRPGRLRWGPAIWVTAPPSPAEWRSRNRSAAAALVNLEENLVAAKLMVKAGRARELAATYDSSTGLLNVKRGEIRVCIEEAAITALALNDAGRPQEAKAILGEADRALQALFRRGNVPSWLYWEAASVWALQGKKEQALGALEQSVRRGWLHGRRGDLPNFEDEPALRTLRGDPRFKAFLASYKARMARERAETARVLGISV